MAGTSLKVVKYDKGYSFLIPLVDNLVEQSMAVQELQGSPGLKTVWDRDARPHVINTAHIVHAYLVKDEEDS